MADEAPKKCFVIMPITVPSDYLKRHGENKDHFKWVYKYIFVPAIKAEGFMPVPPKVVDPELIQAVIVDRLDTADMVLCDTSTGNPNVFYELGIRTALNLPVCLVRDSHTTEIPFDIGNISVEEYTADLMPPQVATSIKAVRGHLRAAQAYAEQNPGNPAWRHYGLTKAAERLSGEGDVGAVLGELVREVQGLRSQMDHQSVGGMHAAASRKYDYDHADTQEAIKEEVLSILDGYLTDYEHDTVSVVIVPTNISTHFEVHIGLVAIPESVRLAVKAKFQKTPLGETNTIAILMSEDLDV